MCDAMLCIFPYPSSSHPRKGKKEGKKESTPKRNNPTTSWEREGRVREGEKTRGVIRRGGDATPKDLKRERERERMRVEY